MPLTEGSFDTTPVPRAYMQYFVPRVYEPWAALLVAKTGLWPGACVLDVASGPGTVARQAARSVGNTGRVIGVDHSVPMVELMNAHSRDLFPIESCLAHADELPFETAFFDAVFCQQGLQFFQNRTTALQEMWRVLQPGGRVGMAVWRSITESQLFGPIYEVVLRTMGHDIADMLRIPFCWPDATELHQSLVAVGFESVNVEQHHLPVVFEGGTTQILDCLLGTPLGTAIENLSDRAQKRLVAELEQAFLGMIKSGKLCATMSANIATARRA